VTGPLWGALPDGWLAGQVKNAAIVTLGKMLQSKDSGSDVCAPYMRAANVQPDGVLALDDVNEMWFGDAELEQLSIRAGDVVVVEGGQGGFGRAAYVDEDLPGWGFQNSINRLRPFGDFDGRFIAFYLIALRASGFIRAYSNAVSMPHLTAEKLARIPMPLPHLEEQRAIADYLDRETARIDTLIKEQQRLIDMLRERRRAVALHAIYEPISAGAVTDKLGRSAHIGNGSTPRRESTAYWDGGDIPWLNSSVVNEPRVTRSEQFVTAVALRECHLPVVAPGSVLVGLTGQGKTRGTATILDIEATVNQHVAYVTPDRNTWLPEYLLWSLRASYDELRRLSEENGSTKGGLTCEALKQFRLAVPALDEQRRIAAYLNEQTVKIDALIAETERFIELARERRAALITAAVTGRIDIRKMA
jgi:type I restriction enzyme S subunit